MKALLIVSVLATGLAVGSAAYADVRRHDY